MPSIDLTTFIKAYDVRGLVATQLTDEVCRALGAAFAQVVVVPDGQRTMVIGHDMRDSSPGLATAFAAGVRAAGVDVTHIGVCATDQLYFASGTFACPGAMITASHNPAAYNGIKMCRARAVPLGTDTGLILVRDMAQWMLDRGNLHPQTASPAGTATGTLVEQNVLADYAAYLHSLVDLSTIRPLRVVVDAGNGMGGLTAPAVLSPLAAIDMIGLYLELDGTFPHHEANPLEPANIVDLQHAVREYKADLGLAFDGDADRCFVVDERGEPVTASAITALVAAREIAKEICGGAPPKDITVVHNTICSRAVGETVVALGARAVVAQVGHSYVKAEMAAHDAVFGGEHSGHYYFRDFWRADTGMLAALHVLAALGSAGDGTTMSTLAAPFDPYLHSGEINSTAPDTAAAAEAVRAWGAADPGVLVSEFDGLSLVKDGEDGCFWTVSVRASNTEPLLRLNVESDEESTMVRVRDEVLAVILSTVSP